ncbi:hypothetical protein FALBO_619 [Fusarium albosuccineum]|uniref:Uncharacterized protein n=1 Tax=Fusarium albosuccineum TaxID=1237068 RepID=A0A8H4LR95_9HYPO|nr:hypothetical protein FALBO_619 [Fusarium albosuccineum]
MSSYYSSSSRSSRSPQAQQAQQARPRTDTIENLRVLEQTFDDPFQAPLIHSSSRTTRVVAFSYHLALSMLESPRGRGDLITTGTEIWTSYSRRQRRRVIIQGDVSRDDTIMPRFVDRFLDKCRADPPNIIVSDRLRGEGLVERVDWPAYLGDQEANYNPKWAALFRLNKHV